MEVKISGNKLFYKNLRFGIFFLILLFIVLVCIKYAVTDRHIDGALITDAYGLGIVQDILPQNSRLRTNEPRTIKYIVIHETGNFSSSANAEAHSSYLKDSKDNTSWHYTVDDTSAFHHIPDDEIAYHAGSGNKNGIGIELCVNNGGDFEKTFINGARLTAKLIDTYGLNIRAVKQHGDFMDKNCPQSIRDNDRWNEFLMSVKKYLKEN